MFKVVGLREQLSTFCKFTSLQKGIAHNCSLK